MKFSISRHSFVVLVDLYRMATAEKRRSEEALTASPEGSPAYIDAAVKAAEAAGQQAGLLVALLNLTREADTCPITHF